MLGGASVLTVGFLAALFVVITGQAFLSVVIGTAVAPGDGSLLRGGSVSFGLYVIPYYIDTSWMRHVYAVRTKSIRQSVLRTHRLMLLSMLARDITVSFDTTFTRTDIC